MDSKTCETTKYRLVNIWGLSLERVAQPFNGWLGTSLAFTERVRRAWEDRIFED
jgi:hypothetical protein